MGQLTLRVNGQPYTLACRDGEEAQLVALAAAVDDKVGQLTAQVGQVGEARLLLMTALLLADEINEVKQSMGVVGADDAANFMDKTALKLERLIEQLPAST